MCSGIAVPLLVVFIFGNSFLVSGAIFTDPKLSGNPLGWLSVIGAILLDVLIVWILIQVFKKK